MNKKLEEALEKDDWELQLVMLYKQDPINYPLRVDKAIEYCEEILQDCASGMYLGEGWHGGMTQEEWTKRKEYIENVLFELKKINL